MLAASAQLGLHFGFVRFMGYFRRSGWYAACSDAWPFEQWLPMDWKAASSPSLRMTLPSCTYTHTPHSILPQPRHVERMRLTSLVDVVLALDSASAVPVPAIPTAAAVAAAIFANVRRVIVSLPMHPPFLWRDCFRAVSSCGSRPLVLAACRPSSGRGVSPAADFELPRACLASACVQRVRRWLRYGGKQAARIRPGAWLRAEWRNHVSNMMALTWEDIS